jgi:hypothetical protein
MFRDFFDQEVNRFPLLDRACVGIPLGDCNVTVAQEVLNSYNIDSFLDQSSPERMSEVMEPEIFDPCPSARGNEAISNRSEGLPVFRIRKNEIAIDILPLDIKDFQKGIVNGDHPVLSALCSGNLEGKGL